MSHAKLKLLMIWVMWLVLVLIPVYSNGQSVTMDPMTLEKALTPIQSLESIAQLMSQNIRFVEDRALFQDEDYWQSPEELWKRKAGDCEDFAVFTQFVLRKINIGSDIVSVYGIRGYAHTVVVFKQDGLYNVFNDGRLYMLRAKSLEDVLSHIHPDWTWASTAERRGTRGWSTKKIHNPASPQNASSVNSFADFFPI